MGCSGNTFATYYSAIPPIVLGAHNNLNLVSPSTFTYMPLYCLPKGENLLPYMFLNDAQVSYILPMTV